MTATKANELPFEETDEKQDTGKKAEPQSKPEISQDEPKLSAEQEAYAFDEAMQIAVAKQAATAHDEEAGEEQDPYEGSQFSPAVGGEGLFYVPLSKLREWENHPRRGSREHSEHAAALTLTAEDPDALRAIVVLPMADGAYPIVDGRFLWAALKAAHAGNEDVEVRCVLFPGTEAEAVAHVCDTALGTMAASEIEKAQALLSLQRTNNVSLAAIADRYAGFTISKVSLMLKAARMREAHPALFDILVEPDRAPISYGNAIFALAKALTADEFQGVIDRAHDLVSEGLHVKPTEAFDALQIERAGKQDGDEPMPTPKVKPIVPLSSEAIHGFDDQPVAAYERLADNIVRIRLPDAAGMSLDEREAAAEACIAQINIHFGLDVEA